MHDMAKYISASFESREKSGREVDALSDAQRASFDGCWWSWTGPKMSVWARILGAVSGQSISLPLGIRLNGSPTADTKRYLAFLDERAFYVFWALWNLPTFGTTRCHPGVG